MKKYLVVTELCSGYPCYKESMSRNSRTHLFNENHLVYGGYWKDLYAKEVNVIDTSLKKCISSTTAEMVRGKIVYHRKTKRDIAEFNSHIDEFMERVLKDGVPF